jgi:hypothetical protein
MLIHGFWTLRTFPERITVLGRKFRKAWWAHPYRGVIQQYREEVCINSMHLMIYKNGRWTITHADKFNPDLGYRIKHLFADVLQVSAGGIGNPPAVPPKKKNK